MGPTGLYSSFGAWWFVRWSSTSSVNTRLTLVTKLLFDIFREETRPFNVIADDPNGVTCLVLDRQNYREMIADELSRLKRDETIRYARKKFEKNSFSSKTRIVFLFSSTTFISGEDERDLKNLRLADIEILCTLGIGGFGRVELVKNKKRFDSLIDAFFAQVSDTRNSKKYSLKQMKKEHIVAMKQQEHVMNERNIMMETRSDFIVRFRAEQKENWTKKISSPRCLFDFQIIQDVQRSKIFIHALGMLSRWRIVDSFKEQRFIRRIWSSFLQRLRHRSIFLFAQ